MNMAHFGDGQHDFSREKGRQSLQLQQKKDIIQFYSDNYKA